MELQLGLSLATNTSIESFNLKNNGFEPKEKVGLEPWSHDVCLDNKRRFEEAFGKMKDASQAFPLLLWSGQPNDEDDRKEDKKRISCSINQ